MHVDRTQGHRAPLLWLALPFAAGIGAAHASPQPLPPSWLAAGALAAVALALTFHRRPRSALVAAIVALAAVGALHHERHRQRLPAWAELPQREAELRVRIDRPLRAGDRNGRVSAIGTVIATPPHLADLTGQALHLQARRFGNPAPVERAGVVTVRGQLEPLPRHPPPDEADGFLAYLIDNGINFRLARGRLLEAEPPASAYARWRAHWARQLAERLGVGLEDHPALAGALIAMVLGQRDGLGEEERELFLRSGTMHLFAISGLHIGVIAFGLHSALRLLRLGRGATVVAGCCLLALYVDLIGLPPSAVRAWLMVTCLQLARLSRARNNPVSAIAGSALLVLLIDPMQLFSAGFQMSYGIVMALLLHGLPLAERWKRRFRLWRDRPEADLTARHRIWRKGWEKVLTAVAMAWAATLVGTVGGIAFFGWFSPLAMLANLALIPLACITIKCGFLALLAAIAGLAPLVLLFNHAAAFVLLVMQSLLTVTMRLPGSAWPAGFAHPLWGPCAICLLLGVMAWGYGRSWQGRWTPPWLPAAVTVVVLVSGLRLH